MQIPVLVKNSIFNNSRDFINKKLVAMRLFRLLEVFCLDIIGSEREESQSVKNEYIWDAILDNNGYLFLRDKPDSSSMTFRNLKSTTLWILLKSLMSRVTTVAPI